MGVTFSESDDEIKDEVDKSILRVGTASAEALVSSYVHHCYPPVGCRDDLLSLFRSAVFFILMASRWGLYNLSLGCCWSHDANECRIRSCLDSFR